jgi:hypothetical protein
MSICIVNIGQTHSGKTTRTIEIIKAIPNKRILVNDIQHEKKYRENSFITKFYGSEKDYSFLIKKLHRTTIILEDAAGYLPHGGSAVTYKNSQGEETNIVRSLARKRFSGNAFILNFHALRQVPEYIMDYVDYFYIGKSRGVVKNIIKKYENYPEIIDAWLNVQEQESPYSFISVKL